MSEDEHGETWSEMRKRSPLEYAATFPSGIGYETGRQARAELAQLRARAAEADALRAERDAATYIIGECENAIGDYVQQLEARGSIMGYGRKVRALCKDWLAAHAPTLCDVCEERPATVERDGHKFCGYCYGSYVALTYGEEFARMPHEKASHE